MSVQNMKYEADANIDTVDLKELETEIAQVDQMMEEMEMKGPGGAVGSRGEARGGSRVEIHHQRWNSSVGVISICEEEPKETVEGETGMMKSICRDHFHRGFAHSWNSRVPGD